MGILFYKKLIRVIICRVLTEFVYINILSPYFSYSGFTWNFDFYREIISWGTSLLFILLIIYTIQRSRCNTSIILELFVYVSIFPSTILYAAGIVDVKSYFLYILYWWLLFIFYNILRRIKFNKSLLIREIHGNYIVYFVALLSVATVLFISLNQKGFQVNFDLYEVYEARDRAKNIPVVLSYLLGVSSASIPTIIIYFLMKKKHFFVLCLFFIQIVNFWINGLKSTFAMFFVTIFCHYCLRKTFLKKIEIFFSALGVLSIFEYYIFKSYYLIDFIIRRVMFVSSQLTFYYMDYFSKNEPDYFSTSLGKFWGEISNYKNIPLMIGDLYLHRDISANCGMVADAYLNLGILGIFLFPIILALFLQVLDYCLLYLDYRIIFVVSVYVMYVLNNAVFTTSLFSHGIIALLILLIMMPKMERENNWVKNIK